MAPVIWGLPLEEIKWSKFKSSYMWNNEYHLRRTKFIVYQCALIFCVVSESLGTAALSDYTDGQRKVQGLSAGGVKVYNNDYVGAASFNIFAGVFVATIFGAAFFFDLFWPERHESNAVRMSWKICGVLAVIFHLAATLTLTIITATHRSHIKGDTFGGLTENNQQFWWKHFPKHDEAPLIYRHNARAIAAVVFGWLGWVSVVPSCVLLFLSIKHNERLGPKSRHARERNAHTTDDKIVEHELSYPGSYEPLSDSPRSPVIPEKPPTIPEPALSDSYMTRDLQVDGAADYAPATERPVSRGPVR